MFSGCNRFLNQLGNFAWDPTKNGVSLLFVRWRKMRHYPIAKSKLNYKRIPTPIDPWEYRFLKTKYDHYRTILKAMKLMFKKEISERRLRTVEGGSEECRIEEEHSTLIEWNDQENARTRKMREERLAAVAQLREEKKMEKLIYLEDKKKQRLEELAKRVQQEMEASKSYITLDNMHEIIGGSLSNPKDYNFIINKSGDVILPENTAWEQLKMRKDQEETEEDVRENKQ